ncbi:unnamed protein product [Phytomonas sp. EM1]|nr:unnamed protein product [Phytomonas sp. EM1]|eukprot:CCW63326.1 unnamed protein product [Phytomonas sp. isolate EM1]
MSTSGTANDNLFSNKAPSGSGSDTNALKLGFDMPCQKTPVEFVSLECNSLINMQIDEMAGSNSSVGSMPHASLGFKYSSTDPTYEAFRRNEDVTQSTGPDTSLLDPTNSKDSTNSVATYSNVVGQDLNAVKAKDPPQSCYASMSHVLVQFGRTYAVCYVPRKHRGTFGLDELVLCEAAHGEATGTSVADLTPYIDEVRTQQAQVLKRFQGDPLCPEENAEGAVHCPLYHKTVTCGLHCDDYLVRLPRILRRGVNKDRKRVHFSHRRNGEALRVIQQLLRERQWDSVLNVAEVAYQGDFLSTTLHLHGHPDSCSWKPQEYRRAGESFTAVLRTNIVEFRHSYACPEQLHLTRNIVGHTLDNLFTKFLRSNGMKKDSASHRRPSHDNLLPPPQRPPSLPAVLQTAPTIPSVTPFTASGLSTSQMSYSSGVSSVGLQVPSNTPCYPPPKYSMDIEAARQKSSSQSSLTFQGPLVIPTPGEGAELRAVVPIQSPVSSMSPTPGVSYLVSLPAAAHAEVPKPQRLYYMVAPQSVPYYTSFVMPQMQMPIANSGVMPSPTPAVYVTSPQLVGYTPPLDSRGLMSCPSRNPATPQQGWNSVPLVDQRRAASIPSANKMDAGTSNSDQTKRPAW